MSDTFTVKDVETLMKYKSYICFLTMTKTEDDYHDFIHSFSIPLAIMMVVVCFVLMFIFKKTRDQILEMYNAKKNAYRSIPNYNQKRAF